jgi:hypothetical protein
MAALARWHAYWPHARSGILLAAALLLAGVACCADFHAVFPGAGAIDYVDADCYARMTRVEEVCRQPGAVLRRHAFENYPFGTRPHTTVPLDYAVWMLRTILLPFMGGQARDLAGAWISPLLGSVMILGIWCWTRAEHFRAAPLTLLVVAASPIVAHGFALGRPDHQSLIAACVAWALAAEWAQWRAPSVGWGVVSGVAWALALWTSLYEPVILLALTFTAALVWRRPALWRRERLPGLAAGGAILLAALAIEGWRVDAPPGFGEGGGAEYFAAWSRQIGELASVWPWSPILAAWTGLGLFVAPVFLWLVRGEERSVARGHLLLVVAAWAFTCWQVRWGYFLPLVYAMSMTSQGASIPPRWRPGAVLLFLVALLPMASEWRAKLHPSADAQAMHAEQQADTAALREVAAFIRQSVAAEPVPADSAATDDGEPDAGILAPWWQSPALAYWSGQPALAGSSHESLPGTVDAARFYLSADTREIENVLRRRRVRWVVAYEPDRILRTAGALLGQTRVSARCMAIVLYRKPTAAPRFLRLALANQDFRVYEVRSSFLRPVP